MRIAFVIDNLGSGGAQRQAVEVAVRLHRSFDAHVDFAIYRELDFFRPRLEEAGIPLARLAKPRAFDPGFPRRLRAWIGDKAPDVVHAFLPLPVIWCALARGRRHRAGPIWIAGERSAPLQNLVGWAAPATRWAYQRFDAVTANSVRAVHDLVHAWKLPAGKVHYLPNGIDLADWDARAAHPCPIALEPRCFHLALVGRLSEEKNHRLFLEAFSRVEASLRRGVRVWFIGHDGPAVEARAVEAEIARRGLGDQVQRLFPTDELAALMARLDGLVLASRFEGSPNVVLEAMASGLPVVASDVGDVPSLVTSGENGWRVPAGDVPALAAALTQLFETSAEARRALGSAGRRRVEERFEIEAAARMHLHLYRRLADELRGGARQGALG